MENKSIFKSDIVFVGIDAAYFTEVLRYFNTLTNRNAPKYKIFIACAHLGLKMNDKERRCTVEIEEQFEKKENEYSNKTYNIPRSILSNHEHEMKSILFLTGVMNQRTELDVEKLQAIWNKPNFGKDSLEGAKLLSNAIMGAKYLLVLFEIDQLNADQINEEILTILMREVNDIKLKSLTDSDWDELEIDEEKLASGSASILEGLE